MNKEQPTDKRIEHTEVEQEDANCPCFEIEGNKCVEKPQPSINVDEEAFEEWLSDYYDKEGIDRYIISLRKDDDTPIEIKTKAQLYAEWQSKQQIK